MVGSPAVPGGLARHQTASKSPTQMSAVAPHLDDQLQAHVRALVTRRLAQLAVSARPFGLDDPVEGVHDLRVASRRLRAFAEVFAPAVSKAAKLEKSLGRITRAVGKLREWDVHRQALWQRHAAASPLGRAAIEHVLEGMDLQRAKLRRRAARDLERVDVAKLTRRVAAALDEVCARARAEAAPQALEPVVARLVGELPPADGREHAEAMHRTRIATKKLRYALELYEPALGPAFQPIHDAATALQELLGDHHDRTVLGTLLTKQAAGLRARRRTSLASGLEDVLEPIEAERRELLARFERGRPVFVGLPSQLRRGLSEVYQNSREYSEY
jgi:CHAD domain-containing protein